MEDNKHIVQKKKSNGIDNEKRKAALIILNTWRKYKRGEFKVCFLKKKF